MILLVHLLCCFLREGEGEDLFGSIPLIKEVKDLLGDDPCLSGAGPGEDQLVAVVLHGLFLRGFRIIVSSLSPSLLTILLPISIPLRIHASVRQWSPVPQLPVNTDHPLQLPPLEVPLLPLGLSRAGDHAEPEPAQRLRDWKRFMQPITSRFDPYYNSIFAKPRRCN